ncbi:TetR/AcrR family transcriptional regulator [Natroniella sulfidigena]|uniref:TetR/AcrR family transcriptional regulator n=1 Tax=Natroniella sulfidigena TaxID=723921 RepID=UPI00200A63F0|nr:TetR/AcrR family transcriptional regulator [Natroniella sulfidigena]MCK8816330.1 TetR/AcrR family transcriptional regulator [Natroniella sulfidigena]
MHPKEERIIEAAIEKFSQQGANTTTIQEVATTAGVGKGTIYRYFDNKEGLISSLIEFGIDKVTKAIKEKLIGLDDPVEKLEAVIIAKLEFYNQNYDFGRFLMREVWGHKDQFEDHIQQIRENHTVILEEIIEEGIAVGKFKEVNVETAAVSLMGMININALHWMMFNQEFPMEELKNDIIELFFAGVLEE